MNYSVGNIHVVKEIHLQVSSTISKILAYISQKAVHTEKDNRCIPRGLDHKILRKKLWNFKK